MSESDFRTPDAREEAASSAAADEEVTGPDAGEVDEEAVRAADGLTPSPRTAEHYREMTEKGAHAQGEGRLP